MQSIKKKALIVPAFLQVSFDHLFDNLESGKINSCFEKNSRILDPKICTNPVKSHNEYMLLFVKILVCLCLDACDLYMWGDGTTGMLGHGENGEENVPRSVEALLSKDIWKVACGVTHTISLTSKLHFVKNCRSSLQKFNDM